MTLALMTIALVVASPGPLVGLDAAGLDIYLERLTREYPTFEARLGRVLEDSIGTPYFDGPLGEGPTGEYDKDPLVDLSRADCVTAVEQAVAMASADNYADFFEKLQLIRYKDGNIDFESRNHFMETDWVRNNAFCEPVTKELGIPLASVTRTISRTGFFERVNAPGVGAGTPDETIAFEYVPSAAVEDAERVLPNNSLILFVGQKPDWLFVLHCGIFVRDVSGGGRLIQASSKQGAVVSMDLGDYVREQGDRYLGLAAYRIREP